MAEEERDPLLQEREKTYGDYKVQGTWAAGMKDTFRSTPQWNNLTGSQKESLDMIVTKISRILHGQPGLKDSWDDITGYAKLASEACPK